MRVLVVSDIHANPSALEAIQEPHDICLCLGDLVEYGVEPAPCIDWVRRTGTVCVRGNHDHGAAQNVDVFGATGFRYLTMATRKATVPILTPADRRFLADLPTTKMLTLGGKRFLLVHASPRDPLDEYVPPDPAAWEARLAGIKADFVLVGHTHLPYTLKAGSTTVVNPGAVGLQRDGDPRARYAVIEDGNVEMKRVEYDVEAAVAAIQAADIDLPAKQQLADVYRHGRYIIPGTNGTNGSYKNGVYTNGHTTKEAVG